MRSRSVLTRTKEYGEASRGKNRFGKARRGLSKRGMGLRLSSLGCEGLAHRALRLTPSCMQRHSDSDRIGVIKIWSHGETE
jgi:hypothetical protein